MIRRNPIAAATRSDLYSGEIAYTDAALGKLLEALRADKLFDGSAIAVMGDHGEALGEHGERGHGVFLYDPTIHVPLLLKLPNGRSAGMRVRSLAGLVDVMPTLLASAGISPPAAMQGKSLLGRLNGKTGDEPAYAETDYPRKAFGWSPLRSVRTGKYLFVEAPRKELYDQSSDQSEDNNLAGTATAVCGTLESRITGISTAHCEHPAPTKCGHRSGSSAEIECAGICCFERHCGKRWRCWGYRSERQD